MDFISVQIQKGLSIWGGIIRNIEVMPFLPVIGGEDELGRGYDCDELLSKDHYSGDLPHAGRYPSLTRS